MPGPCSVITAQFLQHPSGILPDCSAEGFPFEGWGPRGPGGDQKSLRLCSNSVHERNVVTFGPASGPRLSKVTVTGIGEVPITKRRTGVNFGLEERRERREARGKRGERRQDRGERREGRGERGEGTGERIEGREESGERGEERWERERGEVRAEKGEEIEERGEDGKVDGKGGWRIGEKEHGGEDGGGDRGEDR